MSQENAPVCPKCGEIMEEGFILDNAHGTRLQSEWIEGPPEPSRWTGLKLKGRDHLPVTTYRCLRCGYLESYALAD
jgi:predicted nucleic-acid-binding Zn-ribbon protein